jgi:hypothetical protein
MQLTPAALERETLHRLPDLLSDLLDAPVGEIAVRRESANRQPDAVADVRGRRWVFEVKSSSRPGVVASAAAQLATWAEHGELRVLVVPFMTPAGAKTAAECEVNWLDLSGNAHIRAEDLYISVLGKPSQFVARGRPSSPFAPKSSRVARAMLLEPERWWRQKELSATTDLDDGNVSRIVRRLVEDELLERSDGSVRPRDPSLMLDAWSADYRFERHDIILGHVSGSSVELAHDLHDRLTEVGVEHAFTGLPAAWQLQRFAAFRLNSVYVEGDPRTAAAEIGMRQNERGANVQLIGPEDRWVFAGSRDVGGLPCVAPFQVLLDLQHLPERASEAAASLLHHGLWHAPA